MSERIQIVNPTAAELRYRVPLGTKVLMESNYNGLLEGLEYFVVENTVTYGRGEVYTLSKSPYPPMRDGSRYSKAQLCWYIRVGERQWEEDVDRGLFTVMDTAPVFYPTFVEWMKAQISAQLDSLE